MKPPRYFRPRGFTLVELLLVMGIVAVLSAGLGVALQGGDRSVALRSAQGTLASLLTAARGQAALTGRNAALLVSVDPGANNYLHSLMVATRDAADTAWIPTDDWLQLPDGVYVLPPTTPSAGLTAPGIDWGGLRSSAFSSATEMVNSVSHAYGKIRRQYKRAGDKPDTMPEC